MKKLLPMLVVIAAVLAGGFWYGRSRMESARAARVRAVDLAPADTAIFVELPDVGRMGERWQGTALREMVQDWGPTTGPRGAWVLAALGFPEWAEVLALWKQADPATAFFARVDPGGPEPNYVAGFSYRGTKTAVKTAIERGRQVALGGWANVKSELMLWEGHEIESLTSASGTMALAHRDHWFFVAGSVAQMKALLRRYEGGRGGLAGDPKFAECWNEGTPDADFYAYVNGAELHGSLDRAVKRAPKPTGVVVMDKESTGAAPEAVLYSMKMEGREMRGRMFFRMPHPPGEESRAEGLEWHNMYRAMMYQLGSEERWRAWDDLLVSGVYQSELASWMARAMKSGGTVFGPQVWMHWSGAEWWGDGTKLMDGMRTFLAVEVRDPAKARTTAATMAKVLANREVPGRGAPKESEWQTEGTPRIVYWEPDSPDSSSQVSVRLSPTHLTAGNHLTLVASGFSFTHNAPWWKTVREVQTGPEFQALRRRLPGEAMASGSADARAMAQSVFVRVGLALKRQGLKEAGYLEEARFPATAWFSRPPGPQAAVYRVTDHGYVVESLGPFPFDETLLPCALLFLFGKGT